MIYEVYSKRNETFTIEQKLVKVQKTLLITFFDVVASYLYMHHQDGRSIVLTGQRPNDPVLPLLEGLGTHGLDCQRGLYFQRHIIIVQNQIRTVGWKILHLDVV